ncbi:MAG: GSCFA domain-containing protein [Vulcanimicrobiaceae bacterium]|jgi:hypothetical protein
MELGGGHQRAQFPASKPLPWTDFRCTIEGSLPSVWTADETRDVTVRVTNPTASFFVSAPPMPIFASFKWLAPDEGSYVDTRRAYRTQLPHTLEPGESVDIAIRVVAPVRAGPARLRITLVQEGVSWFDEQDPTAALEAVVELQPAPPAEAALAPLPDASSHTMQSSPLRQRKGSSARTIYVSGNCQGRGVAACMYAMNQSLAIKVIPLEIAIGEVAPPDQLVVRQRNPRLPWTLRPAAPNEILYPRAFYNAFHPDCVRLDSLAPAVMSGRHHSTLVLYGWHRGLSVAQTIALFNERVFEALGFFDYAPASDRVLIDEGDACQLDLRDMLPAWRRRGAFMHTINHPKLRVLADFARAIMRRAEIDVLVPDVESFVIDPLQGDGVWPVYPELGARWGLPGAYAFMRGYDPKFHLSPELLDLETYVARSFEVYAGLDPPTLTTPRLEHPLYRDLEHLDAPPPKAPSPPARPTAATASTSPYAALPDERFWRRAVERVPANEVDPVASPPYSIEPTTRIAAIGSCFAQRVSHALISAGYDVLEANCGNIYTARQLLQLFDRAFGTLTPQDEAWLREDGRYVDPFRPQLQPDGFASVEAVRASRAQQLTATRALFTDADVVVLTLGLTEMWYALADGAVFPLAPGVAGGLAEPERYGFHNATVAEIAADLHAFIERLGKVNANAHVVLTVSPQPPIATYEPRHVLTAATYTKAALRAAVDEVERAHSHVTYFPGYEIVAGSFSRGMYFESDLRSVNPAGVDRVMRLFFEHYTRPAERAQAVESLVLDESRTAIDVLCDEDQLDAKTR